MAIGVGPSGRWKSFKSKWEGLIYKIKCDIVYSYGKKNNHKQFIKNVINLTNLLEYKDSKSFLSVLVLMCRCVLYPRAKLFVTSGGKEQAAGIVKEKVNEICTLVPAFDRELDRRPGKTREGKDYVCYMFKNGSFFDNIAANEKSRGKRRHGGLVEECVGVDGTILSEVIIPTMNVSRLCMDGTMHPEETLNKSQIFVTTAGYKNTFAGLMSQVIGEVKLGEPRNGVCALRANSENIVNVWRCAKLFNKRRFRDYRKHTLLVEVSRVGIKSEAPRI